MPNKSKAGLSTGPSMNNVGGKSQKSKNGTPKRSVSRMDTKISTITQATPNQVNGEAGTTQMLMKYCNKRKTFTRFVMTCGIKAAVVRALVALYEEPVKPDNALDYMVCFMGGDIPTDEEVKSRQEEIRRMRDRIHELEEQNQNMRNQIAQEEERVAQDLSQRDTAEEFEGDDEEEYFEEASIMASINDLEGLDSCVTSNLSFAVHW